MPYYKTTIYRSNFSFGGEIKQSFDVVFYRKEKEYKSELFNSFSNSASNAAKKQIPVSDPKNSGLPLDEGWSSFISSGEFIKLDMPWSNWKIQLPSPGKPVIGCIFKDYNNMWMNEPRSYRAESFYKLIHRKKDCLLDKIIPNPRKWDIIKCLPKDAQIISGYGICGFIGLIKNVQICDLVQWNKNQIKQYQYEYVKKIENKEYGDNYDILKYADEWAKELGLTK